MQLPSHQERERESESERVRNHMVKSACRKKVHTSRISNNPESSFQNPNPINHAGTNLVSVSGHHSLVGSTSILPVETGLGVQDGVAGHVVVVLLVLLVFVVGTALVVPGVVLRVSVVERSVLAREVVTLGAGLDVVAAALREHAGAVRQLGRDGGLLGDPVGERVLAVLDDGLAGLVAVVGGAGLAGRDGGVVDQLEQVLAVAGDNGHLLAVLAERVELVRVGRLDLLARNVGQLGLGHQRLGLGPYELLLENHYLRRVGLLVHELGDVIRYLLFAWVEQPTLARDA